MTIRQLLVDHPVVDGHNDLLWAMRELVDYDFDRLDLAAPDVGRALGTHTDLPRARAGGLGAQFWSVFVPADLGKDAAVTATLQQIDAAHTMISRYDELSLATSVADIEAAWSRGQIASLLGAEGGHQIADSLAVLRVYARLGIRYLTLTHNYNVSWADSATDVAVHHGLSDFGVDVVSEMNRLGVIVDLSHVSAEVMHHALDVTTDPVLFSHSSARAVCDHPRNVPDDVLARLAANGGVCMVTFVPYFVSQAVRDWQLEAEAAAAVAGVAGNHLSEFATFMDSHAREHPRPPCGIGDVVAHLEHVREVAGIDHIGLGGDYDGVGWLPDGLADVSSYPRLLQALADVGWSAGDLAKLTCRNALRVIESTEKA